MPDLNTDHILTRGEWMTHFRNQWGEAFYAKVVDFYKAKEKWKKNPAGKEVTQVGDALVEVPLAQKVESLGKAVENAKDMMDKFDAALAWKDDEFAAKVKEILDFINKPKLDLVVPK